MRILVTGGAGFIGGHLIIRLLRNNTNKVFNLDKLGYASDIGIIEEFFKGAEVEKTGQYNFIKTDLACKDSTENALYESNPDLVIHLAAESHVDRSIENSIEFLNSNVLGTYNLLEASRKHWENLSTERKNKFKFHHISTDEVYGSLSNDGFFSELSPYNPKSPYSASKASSDLFVKSWNSTYGLPTLLTNCSNNFGPWQFPEKFIPLVISKAINSEDIPIYGDGSNVRDWLYVEDHIDAILMVINDGNIGSQYCIGGYGEKTNNQIVGEICKILDKKIPENKPHSRFIKYVKDRPGHDQRYAIDPKKISIELGWKPKNSFAKGLEKTIDWYIKNQNWFDFVKNKSGYFGERLGIK